ncbi:phytochelatin synthase [Dongia mobilis]|uniref:glutathione gamma-glutamylcysteinyltransferase n=1 Tax=Dongia mobilis TaxID=578943 RepID=A0A4R6WT87_9PROT|nr:phytochelatin synthase family protein [Dongia mobilis]TDQ86340.1 phytochelatin synthase [Dongia mobilis]
MNDIGTLQASTEQIALTPLARDNAHVRRNPCPNFWALMPHQIHQHTDSACSLASSVMVLNAARGMEGMNRVGELLSEKRLIERFVHTDWPSGIAPDGGGRKLMRLAEHLDEALGLYGLASWMVEGFPVAAADAAAGDMLRRNLAALEAWPGHFIIANFHLDLFYGDGSDIGHFSPLGAYDSASDRVLVLDCYKADYEPHWAPVARLLAAMAKPCDDGKQRGYLVVRRR